MITLTNSYVNIASDAVLTNCIVKESVTDSDCTNVISPTFINCTDAYCVSADATAIGIGSQNIGLNDAFVDASNDDYRINQSWANTYLVGKGIDSSDIVSTYYHVVPTDVEITVSFQSIVLTGKKHGVYTSLPGIAKIEKNRRSVVHSVESTVVDKITT